MKYETNNADLCHLAKKGKTKKITSTRKGGRWQKSQKKLIFSTYDASLLLKYGASFPTPGQKLFCFCPGPALCLANRGCGRNMDLANLPERVYLPLFITHIHNMYKFTGNTYTHLWDRGGRERHFCILDVCELFSLKQTLNVGAVIGLSKFGDLSHFFHCCELRFFLYSMCKENEFIEIFKYTTGVGLIWLHTLY